MIVQLVGLYQATGWARWRPYQQPSVGRDQSLLHG